MDFSNKALFDGAYISELWHEHKSTLLEKCNGLIFILSPRTLWDTEVINQVRAAAAKKTRMYIETSH